MEAKDLMIGDLVRVNRDVCIKNDTIVRVCGIDATNRLVEKGLEGSATCVPVDDIDFYSGGIWVKYLSPIPLTPEILEKNGFENDFYEDESVADYVKVRNEGYSLHSTAHEWDLALISWCNGHVDVVTDFSGEYRGEIEYVHELQHALRLCGIDKEIVI